MTQNNINNVLETKYFDNNFQVETFRQRFGRSIGLDYHKSLGDLLCRFGSYDWRIIVFAMDSLCHNIFKSIAVLCKTCNIVWNIPSFRLSVRNIPHKTLSPAKHYYVYE